MKLPKYNFFLINPRSNSRIRQIRSAGFFLIGLTTLFLIGSAGVGRLVWFATMYGKAKLGFYEEHVENERLFLKVSTLDKYIFNETIKLNDLVVFEDIARLTYGMDPISTDVRRAGVGGPLHHDQLLDAPNPTEIIKQAVAVQESLTVLLRKVQLQNATFAQMGECVEHLHKSWAQRPSIWPATGTVTSGFGARSDPMSGESTFHEGMDIANEIGTPVFAPADGIVEETDYQQNFGRIVVINHPECGIQTIYGHLHNYVVTPRQNIHRGDLIGFIGNSGKSTGPHLHYEIRQAGHPISPSPYLLPSDRVVD
jgi:hypothetical protein